MQSGGNMVKKEKFTDENFLSLKQKVQLVLSHRELDKFIEGDAETSKDPEACK